MSFFDRMKDSVSSAGIGVSQKFSHTADTMKLNNQIRNNEKEIEKLIIQVGQRCLELHLADEESEYEEFFSEIRRRRAENEKYQAEIQRLTEESQEQARLRHLEIQQKQEQRERERREQEVLKQQEAFQRQMKMQENLERMVKECPKCGQKNDPDAKFCVCCGNPLVKEENQQKAVQPDAPQAQTDSI